MILNNAGLVIPQVKELSFYEELCNFASTFDLKKTGLLFPVCCFLLHGYTLTTAMRIDDLKVASYQLQWLKLQPASDAVKSKTSELQASLTFGKRLQAEEFVQSLPHPLRTKMRFYVRFVRHFAKLAAGIYQQCSFLAGCQFIIVCRSVRHQ
jgi:hypothetical protein